MNGFAPLLAAIALAQPVEGAAPGEPAGAAAVPEPAAVDAGRAPPHPGPPPAPTATTTPTLKATATTTPKETPTPTTTPKETPTTTPKEMPTTTATSAPTATATSTGPPAKRVSPGTSAETQRTEADRLPRAFIAALARGDADELAALCAQRFSFDGDSQSGREAVRRRWRGLLAGRASSAPALGRIEVISSADAVARHGQPPARIAPLVSPGVLVAIADVGGRTVVLFLAREGGRLAVTGMHD